MNYQNMSIKEIKHYISKISIENYQSLIEDFSQDDRKSVRQLSEKLEKELDKYYGEITRLETMSLFEKKYYSEGYHYIGGMDEVGRGPLAGPVVSAVVILPKNCHILHINDSKKLSSNKREELFYEIKEKALDIGIGIVDAGKIDEINIYQATKVSMALAVQNLKKRPDFLLIDAMKCEGIPIPQLSIIEGDNKSISIAAASIIAKVTRDRMMVEYHEKYPYYAFDKNKGYGTLEHRQGIAKYGVSDIHRRTFLKKIIGN